MGEVAAAPLHLSTNPLHPTLPRNNAPHPFLQTRPLALTLADVRIVMGTEAVGEVAAATAATAAPAAAAAATATDAA